MATGFTITLFYPDGEPNGFRTICLNGWTGHACVFPRSLLKEVSNRKELNRTAVYVLWGDSEDGELPQVYVGETDSAKKRLMNHSCDGDKDFWSHTVVFTSTGQNLNVAHVKYLEARLLQLAIEAKRCELQNRKVHQLPSLSEAEKANTDSFLSNMLLCLPVASINFFELSEAISADKQQLFLNAKDIKGVGFEGLEGFVVCKGSTAVMEEVLSISHRNQKFRKYLLLQGVIEECDGCYRFAQDYTFSSPSAASDVLLGRSSNGRTEWKDASGRTLKVLQETSEEC